ncbi:MAG: DegT/DnrJ/EryC1/StrS family aminotransferase [Planctomycetes bacterium]|nr:DegT/DnrJ/EryC1/StrS family aminotransferase [Planctomycetota bacterium]
MKVDLKNKFLAIHGGSKVRNTPWIDNYTCGEEEKLAACRAIDSGYLSKFEGSFTPDPPFSFWGGPFVQELENNWCDYYGCKYAVSMNSATSGLYAALGALGVGYGDEVIVSPSTMTACAVGPLIYGAIPIFADIERETGALDCRSVASLINERTRCVIVIHQFGIPADMDELIRICRPRNIRIIEDCAQAHGAKYKGRYVGTIGDVGVFSLNVNKTIQCGEGAVCTTNDESLRERLALIRNHAENVAGPAGIADLTNLIGFNYRLTEVQAAIAIEQLKKLDCLNQVRMEMVGELNDGLRKFDYLRVLDGRPDCVSTYYILPLLFREAQAGVDIESFRQALCQEGCYFFRGYKPLYLQPLYQTKTAFKHGYPFSAPANADIKTNYHSGACPVAESLRDHELLQNEHIRPPQSGKDIRELISMFEKLSTR